MATYNIQVEDSAGNKYHPKPDLLTTKEQLRANTAAGKSVDALVVKELDNNLTSQLGGVKILAEGSGTSAKYYAQIGADTASKKLLGNAKVKATYIDKGTSSYTLTADTGYKFITAFLSRYEAASQHAFWSEDFTVHYAAGNTTQNTITVSADRQTITANKLDTNYRFYLCGVQVPA